jgi:hypothetical protein
MEPLRLRPAGPAARAEPEAVAASRAGTGSSQYGCYQDFSCKDVCQRRPGRLARRVSPPALAVPVSRAVARRRAHCPRLRTAGLFAGAERAHTVHHQC